MLNAFASLKCWKNASIMHKSLDLLQDHIILHGSSMQFVLQQKKLHFCFCCSFYPAFNVGRDWKKNWSTFKLTFPTKRELGNFTSYTWSDGKEMYRRSSCDFTLKIWSCGLSLNTLDLDKWNFTSFAFFFLVPAFALFLLTFSFSFLHLHVQPYIFFILFNNYFISCKEIVCD